MRRNRLLPIVALALGAFAPALPAAAQEEHRATDAQRLRRYKGAIAKYERALRLLEKNDRDGALDALAVSVQEMPDFPDAHFLRARLLYGAKDYSRALEEIVAARAAYERTADLRAGMQADRRKALTERLRAKDAAISEQSGRLGKASADQRQQIERLVSRLQGERFDIERELHEHRPDPQGVPARYSSLHGNVLLRLGRDAEAISQYEEALKSDPAWGEAANNLASLYHVAGKHERALEIVTEAEKLGAPLHPELRKSIEAALARRP